MARSKYDQGYNEATGHVLATHNCYITGLPSAGASRVTRLLQQAPTLGCIATQSKTVLLEAIVSYYDTQEQQFLFLATGIPYEPMVLVQRLLCACTNPRKVYKFSCCIYVSKAEDRQYWNEQLNGRLAYFARDRGKVFFNVDVNPGAAVRACREVQQSMDPASEGTVQCVAKFDNAEDRCNFLNGS